MYQLLIYSALPTYTTSPYQFGFWYTFYMKFENPDSVLEKIKASAIRFQNQIFTGNTHVDALNAMSDWYPDWRDSDQYVEDGFITNTGRFVDRREAGEIAEKAGQLDDLDLQKKARASEAFQHRKGSPCDVGLFPYSASIANPILRKIRSDRSMFGV